MKKLTFTKCALAALVLAPASAFAADGISYTYLEADYIIQDIDLYENEDVFDDFVENVDDGDGFGVTGSLGVTNHLFIFGSYSQTEADFSFVADTGLPIVSGQDIKTVNLGVGFFTPINLKTDLVARAGYTDTDIGDFSFGADDNDIFDDDETIGDAIDDLNEDSSDGYFIDLGVRAQTLDWLELGGGIRYTDLDQGDDVSAFGNLLFEISPNLGINIAADFGDNVSLYKAGVRFSF